jgi:hypothetical protein
MGVDGFVFGLRHRRIDAGFLRRLIQLIMGRIAPID